MPRCYITVLSYWCPEEIGKQLGGGEPARLYGVEYGAMTDTGQGVTSGGAGTILTQDIEGTSNVTEIPLVEHSLDS